MVKLASFSGEVPVTLCVVSVVLDRAYHQPQTVRDGTRFLAKDISHCLGQLVPQKYFAPLTWLRQLGTRPLLNGHSSPLLQNVAEELKYLQARDTSLVD
eukprot:6248825-Amphidinium_carterae.1